MRSGRESDHPPQPSAEGENKWSYFKFLLYVFMTWLGILDSSWNVLAHGDAREGKWRGNWRMEWVASTLHTTSEHGVPSITTADAHTSAACSRLNWRSHRFKWNRPFRRKTKSGFCACAFTFQKQSTFFTFICYDLTSIFPIKFFAKRFPSYYLSHKSITQSGPKVGIQWILCLLYRASLW